MNLRKSDYGSFLLGIAAATVARHFEFSILEWVIVLAAVSFGVKLLHDNLIVTLTPAK